MTQKIVFAGTPDFAATSLKALLDAGIRPCAVYTQPDRAAKRGHKLTPTPVKELALSAGLEVRTPANFKDEKDVEDFKALDSDLCIVAAYGVILPDAVLEAPRCGCVNIHGSLLPRYRGAAPIQRALLEGCSTTGVTLIKLEHELDAGGMYASAELKIEDDDTSGTLFEKLADLGAKLLMKNLGPILAGTLRPEPQDASKATYAKKLSKDMAPLDFKRGARELGLLVRALNPWPVATATLGETVYKVFEAVPLDSGAHADPGAVLSLGAQGVEVACSEGSLLLKVIQAPGKGRVNAGDMARSNPQKFRGAHFG
jgi:methionyl-tRNA formyltransferase